MPGAAAAATIRASPGTDASPKVDAPPKITAKAWLVADLNTGQILAAKNPHRPLAPASTLKALTLLALAPSVPVDDTSTRYVATDADAGIDGSKVGLVPGSRYRPVDLYHGLMLGSGNDCAHALAELAGGQNQAVALMAAEAARLGAADTVVRNTSGLDAKGQVSSVHDLALFGREVLARPELADLVATTSYTFPAKGKNFGSRRDHFQIQNHNRLLRNYDGALGVKNGYTVAAGGSFIGAARRGDQAYVVTVLKAKGSTWHAARDLLDWAFANGDAAAGGAEAARLGRLADPGNTELNGAELSNTDPGGSAPGETDQGDAGADSGAEIAVQALAAPVGSGAAREPVSTQLAGAVGLGLAGFVGLLLGLRLVGRRRAARLPLAGPRHGIHK